MAEGTTKRKRASRGKGGLDMLTIPAPPKNTTHSTFSSISSVRDAKAQPAHQRERKLPAVHPITSEVQEQIDLLNDLKNFIGIGTVEIEMPRRAAQGMEAPDEWFWLDLPDAVPPKWTIGSYLYDLLLQHVTRYTYRMIRNDLAKVRVYVLPDDVGRGCISRKDPKIKRILRKAIDRIDVSIDGWNGLPVKKPLPLAEPEDERSSLFYMFNTKESPKPDPDASWIKDENTKELLRSILSSRPITGMKTKLYEYQKRSVAMMLQRELAPMRTMDSRLCEVIAPTGKKYFMDLIANTFHSSPSYFDDVRGGILAEELGLGKTLISLAVILATQHQFSAIPEEFSLIAPPRKQVVSLMQLSAETIWKNAIPWRGWDLGDRCVQALKDSHGYYEISQNVGTRSNRYTSRIEKERIHVSIGTIIVCPSNLIQQWRSEIDKHVEHGRLRVLVLAHSRAKIPTVEELLDYDIILFSRPRFDQEEKTGKDALGRKEGGGIPRTCQCPYIGATRVPDCRCLSNDAVYKSPLMYIRWKRLIVDEGHSMGSGKSNSVQVAALLHAERRWVVSGTPASGLMGISAGMNVDEGGLEEMRQRKDMLLAQKKDSHTHQDLDHFGRIVKDFLKLQPWAAADERGVQASWSTYITKGFTERRVGTTTCLRNLVDNLIIRHRQEDVEEDVILPPLHHKFVLDLKPGLYEKLSMNLFVATLSINAVTSERTDKDYMFHPSNRGPLRTVVNNLLKGSSFYWTGFSKAELEAQIQVATEFLAKKQYNEEDTLLLKRSVEAESMALGLEGWQEFSRYGEMGYFLASVPEEVSTWALTDVNGGNSPAIFGGTQVLDMQKHVNTHSYVPDLLDSLHKAGLESMVQYRKKVSTNHKSKSKDSEAYKRGVPSSSMEEHKKPRNTRNRLKIAKIEAEATPASGLSVKGPKTEKPQGNNKSILKNSGSAQTATIPPDSPLAKARLIGTASRKLSYLLDQILKYHQTEKILVFYETEDVAFYIAQALEIVGIEYLAYAKTLSGQMKASYIVTFHHSEAVRVLLMDLSQAAHGLNVSSANRVFFVNPVWQPNIEAQALKRAHRIGQTKPVYAETLVLQGTVEEALIKRRNAMSDSELDASKANILNDGKMRNILSTLQFLDVGKDEVKGLGQVSQLQFPQLLFGDGKRGGIYSGSLGIMNVESYDDGLNMHKRRDPSPKRDTSPVRSDLPNVSGIIERGKKGISQKRGSKPVNPIKKDVASRLHSTDKMETNSVSSSTTPSSTSRAVNLSQSVETTCNSTSLSPAPTNKRKVGFVGFDDSISNETSTNTVTKRKKAVQFA